MPQPPPPKATSIAHRVQLAERVQACRLLPITYARWVIRPDRDRSEHAAPRPKLIFIDSGRMEYHLPQATLTLKPGDVLFRPGWVTTRWRAGPEQPLKIWYCEWSFESSESVMPRPLWAPGSGEEIARGLAGPIETAMNLHRGDPLHRWALVGAEAELRALVTRFLLHCETPTPDDTAADDAVKPLLATPSTNDARVWLQRLEHTFAQPDALDRLYREARVSPSQVRRLFKSLTGLSPSSYLTQLRMRAARYYLGQGQHSVKEAAASVGYHNPRYFSRLYARHWGHPPRDDMGRAD